MKETATQPALGEAQVRSIAKLAHLDLSPEEIEAMSRDLTHILGYVEQIAELDLEGVEPTAHVQIESAALRPDVPSESLPHELAVLGAPLIQNGGFAVPAFVDEG